MKTVFEAMPGLEMPVPEVTKMLTKMWQSHHREEGKGQSLYRASQLNLILHNGLLSTEQGALKCFKDAIEFAQKYPCRIIVLCPGEKKEGETHLKGKLFSECYIGEGLREECCCEALIIGYSAEDAEYLKNQISLWIENDLPSYYWVNKVSTKAMNEHYLELAESSKKVIYDSRIEEEEFEEINWPEGKQVSDLALLRLLPVRQSLGVFLSGYKPEVLVEGLTKVTVEAQPQYTARGMHLLEWFEACLEKCAEACESKSKPKFKAKAIKGKEAQLKAEWIYNNGNSLTWSMHNDGETAYLEGKFGEEKIYHRFQLKPMTPAETLAGAVFY